jgi:hypothetical protein
VTRAAARAKRTDRLKRAGARLREGGAPRILGAVAAVAAAIAGALWLSGEFVGGSRPAPDAARTSSAPPIRLDTLPRAEDADDSTEGTRSGKAPEVVGVGTGEFAGRRGGQCGDRRGRVEPERRGALG